MTIPSDPSGERISDAEHAVMEVLWDRSPRSAADVCEAICETRDWTIATVKTLLSRLVAKGDPARSVLYERVNRRGGGQMPPTSSNRVDAAGARLLAEWIKSLK